MKKAQDQQGHLLQYNNSYITGLCPKKQNAIKGSHVRISNKHYFLSRKFDYWGLSRRQFKAVNSTKQRAFGVIYLI